MEIESSPVYLDTNAPAKLYVPEPESDALDATLAGRHDLLVSELAVTELTSALARRVRERSLDPTGARRVYNQLLRDLRAGELRLLDITSATDRQAERILLTVGRQIAVRSADSLHLAAAALADARAFITYDRQPYEAALALGSFEVFGGR